MQATDYNRLDALIEFDVPFNLSNANHRDGWATFRDSTDYAPGYDLGDAPDVNVNAKVDEHGDAHVTGDAWIDQPMKMFTSDRWSFYSRGYTGQFGVKRNDPVMHPSEYVGGKLARDMIDDGGTYVVTSVRMLPDSEEYDDANDGDLVGWVVLRKDED